MRAVAAAQLRAVQSANAAEASRHRAAVQQHRHRCSEADGRARNPVEHYALTEQRERARVTMWVDNIEERLQRAEDKLAVLVTGLEAVAQLRHDAVAPSSLQRLAQKTTANRNSSTHSRRGNAPLASSVKKRPSSGRSQSNLAPDHHTASAPSLRRPGVQRHAHSGVQAAPVESGAEAAQLHACSGVQPVSAEIGAEALQLDAIHSQRETQQRLLDEMALTRAAILRAKEGERGPAEVSTVSSMPLQSESILPSFTFRAPNVSERSRLLLDKVLIWLPPIDFLRAIPPLTHTGWSFTWYMEQLGAILVAPDQELTINGAINKSGSLDGDATSSGFPGATNPGGLVCLQPGIYQETVRIARSCFLCGLGAPGKVVIEGKGIGESPLVFVRGENACVSNLTVRCKNQAMRAKCVYIPSGRPLLEHCVIEGGVHACGAAPCLRHCSMSRSPGCGIHFSDGCGGEVSKCTITGNKLHGVLTDRDSWVTIIENRIEANKGFGICMFLGARGATSKSPVPNYWKQAVRNNAMIGNGGGDVSVSGAFADGIEEEEEDMHLEGFDLFG